MIRLLVALLSVGVLYSSVPLRDVLASAPPAISLAPQHNDGPIPIHPKHPQAGLKSHYTSRAEWPRPSSQTHWKPSENPIEHLLLHLRKISHAHMECALPIYGITARATLTFNCQVQAFHMPGRVEVFSTGLYFPDIVIEWDRPEPMIGDPNGVVIRQINVTLSANTMPLKGVWRVAMTARARLDNGTHYDDTQEIPLCVNCDGTEPEEAFILTTHVSGFFNIAQTPGARGGPTVDLFGFAPIIGVPLDRRYELPVRAFAYQQDATFPGSGAFEQVHRPNIHFGDPGILFRRLVVPPPAVNGINDVAIFDPVVLGPGKSKVSLGWHDDTEGGNARFAPGETFSSFVVVEVLVGDAVPPPPPPDPIPCDGTLAVTKLGPGRWRADFTQTQAPQHGGTACPPATTYIGG